jgi:O-antigen ligase
MILNRIAQKEVFGQTLPEFLAKSAIYIILAGIFCVNFARALPNIAIITLTISALLYSFSGKQKLIFPKERNFLPFIGIFFLFVLSYLMTEEGNWKYASAQLILKLQYLAFPVIFILLPSFKERTYHNFFFFFFILVLVASFISTYYFLIIDKRELLEQYGKSKIFFTVIDHVRFSLFVCLSIFLGIYLLVKKYAGKTSFVFWLLFTGTIFLILFLHILAVRSGLVACYTLFILLSIYFLISKHYKASIFIAGMIIFSGLLSYNYIDTLRVRYLYTLYDLQMSENLNESGNDYSISRRILANKVALSIFSEHPVVGVGEGNIRSEIHRIYNKNYPSIRYENILMPHNQFLRQLASTGITGLLIFVVCFYYPLFYRKNYKHIPLLVIYIIVTLSFLVEDTLDTQLGLTFSLFFIMINLHFLKKNPLLNTNAEKDHYQQNR